MTCNTLYLTFKGTNELQDMTARSGPKERVEIREGDGSLMAGNAHYTATNGMLRLTEHPHLEIRPAIRQWRCNHGQYPE